MIQVLLVAVAWSAALWALPDLVEWIGGDPPASRRKPGPSGPGKPCCRVLFGA